MQNHRINAISASRLITLNRKTTTEVKAWVIAEGVTYATEKKRGIYVVKRGDFRAT